MTASTATSATGGSAGSQADERSDDRRWDASPRTATAVRVVIFTTPLLAGYVAGTAAAQLVPRSNGFVGVVAWWIAIMAASSIAIWASRPLLQRLAPLAFLYKCTLVFPDSAPARYRVALRASRARELQRRVENGESLDSTPARAASDILALLAALNDHDRRTRGHSERVRAYADLIAEEMGVDEDDRVKLHWAALLHDIGKLTVSADILNKNGRPTDAEWQELRGHPGAAAPILLPLRPWLGRWVDAATEHHERWDGTGYPRGTSGTDVSLAGRIVAVADAYDVMTSSRSYKTAWSADDARRELANCAGTQFDPRVVRAFLGVSTSKLARVSGPLSWLAHAPKLAEVVSAAASAGSSTAVAAGGAAVAASAAVMPVIALTYEGPVTLDTVPTTVAVATDTTAIDAPVTVTSTTDVPVQGSPRTDSTTDVPLATIAPTTAPPPSTTTTTADQPEISRDEESAAMSVVTIDAADLNTDLRPGAIESNASVLLVREATSTVLTADIVIVGHRPGAAVTAGNPADFTIRSGSTVCSYLIHADAEATQGDTTGQLVYEADITFDTTVLGFITDGPTLEATDAFSVAQYEHGVIEPGDIITVNGTTMRLTWSVADDTDQVRVLTSCA